MQNGYKEIKDVISHIDEFHKEADLRESLQEILGICEKELSKPTAKSDIR